MRDPLPPVELIAGTKREQKRETNGQYAFDGNFDRMCVCGHTLGVHSAGSPSDCLFYSLPECERTGQPGADKPQCGCLKFRLSRRKPFEPGDVVSFCGDEATVVANYGDYGAVRCNGDDGLTKWWWVFQGEPVKLVRRARTSQE